MSRFKELEIETIEPEDAPSAFLIEPPDLPHANSLRILPEPTILRTFDNRDNGTTVQLWRVSACVAVRDADEPDVFVRASALTDVRGEDDADTVAFEFATMLLNRYLAYHFKESNDAP